MEILKYIIEDSTIAELLGVQNFSTDEAAILELVKNSYDANAMTLKLVFQENSLSVLDDGIGMNASDIKKHWMHIGKSSKEYKIVDDNNNIRIQAGSKGVGRFALSRLGRNIHMISKKIDAMGVIWKTDWNESELDEINTDFQNGTQIIINNLREKWTKKRIELLCNYLERTYNDEAMKIEVITTEGIIFITKHFPKPVPGKNCKGIIDLRFDGEILSTEIKLDEFQDEAQKWCKNVDIHKSYFNTNIIDEFKGGKFQDLLGDEYKNRIKEIGPFFAALYFNVSPTRNDQEKFLYKCLSTPESIEPGVILYRNAFSISSYDGSKDWLGLGVRSRQSPAAASHPTGAWRVRENQLSGYIQIDKRDNKVLRDMANRQGLDENIYYDVSVKSRFLWT